MSWFDRYFTSEWEKCFKKQSYKQNFNDRSLAEEAFQDAWGKLFETLQNSEVGRLPEREEKRDAYVFKIFINLLNDVHRKRFGRCRPYEWVKRLGRLWEDVAILLCQEDLSVTAMTERLCNNPRNTSDGACEERVKTAVRQLRLKHFCKLIGVEKTGVEDFNLEDENRTPHQQLEHGDLVSLVETLLALDQAATGKSSAVDHIVEKWQEISKQVALSDDERLILTRVYLEGDSIKQAAQELGLSKYHTARRLKDAALQRIRSVLEQFDVSIEAILGTHGSEEYYLDP